MHGRSGTYPSRGPLIYCTAGWEVAAYPAWKPPNLEQPLKVIAVLLFLAGCSTCLVPTRFLMFGGWDGHKINNDAYFYYPLTGAWVQIMPGPLEGIVAAPQAATITWPKPLAWHTATLIVDHDRCTPFPSWRFLTCPTDPACGSLPPASAC